VHRSAFADLNHNSGKPNYLTEYNALATVASRLTGYTAPQSLREDPALGAKCFRNMSLSVKNAFVLERLGRGSMQHSARFSLRDGSRTDLLLC
jgi:hypothetical protein